VLGQAAIPAIGDLQVALRQRKERGCRTLLRVIAEASETVYRPYLREIWNLTEFAKGSVPAAPPPKYGTLVRELEQRIGKLSGVVEPLAVRVRNAADHGELHEYDSVRRCMVLTSERPPWRAEMSYDDLRRLAEQIITVAGTTFPRAAHWFQQDAMVRSGLFNAVLKVLPALERDDHRELERIGHDIETLTHRMYEDLARLFAASKEHGKHLMETAETSRRWLSRVPGTPTSSAPGAPRLPMAKPTTSTS
jgi:hypothetical protein